MCSLVILHQQVKCVSQKRGDMREVEMSELDVSILKDILGLGLIEAEKCLGHTGHLSKWEVVLSALSHPRSTSSINGKNSGQIFGEITYLFLKCSFQSSKEALSNHLTSFQFWMVTHWVYRWSSDWTLVQEAVSLFGDFKEAILSPLQALCPWMVAS